MTAVRMLGAILQDHSLTAEVDTARRYAAESVS